MSAPLPLNKLYIIVIATVLLVSCSTVSNLPEGEVLYTGLKKTVYVDKDSLDFSSAVEEEVEAAIACAPNGALLGSSYYCSPIQIRLWIYNACAHSKSKFSRWLAKTFGREPVLIRSVNPSMRSLVAKNVLRNNGYLDADVGYEEIAMHNPKKAKIRYTVKNNHRYTIDTVEYLNYSPHKDSLILTTLNESYLKSGSAFTLSSLDAERNRLSNVFRNNGYYNYLSSYTTFIADSVSQPGKIALHVQQSKNVPDEVERQWYLGDLKVIFRRSSDERITDSIVHRFLSVYYSGKKIPIRMSTILRDIKLRPGGLYSLKDYQESYDALNSLGLFSTCDFNFVPRDTSSTCDTLNMVLTCEFNKPYDGSIEAKYVIKSNDRTGPGLSLGVTKRNAFRGAEKLTIELFGGYEWQTGHKVNGNSSALNSYEYGVSASIEYPRLETPFHLFRRHRFYKSPSTIFSLSANVQNRADYFNMLTLSIAVTYKFQTSATSRHEFSPLLFDYNILQSTTASFDSIISANPAIYISMRDQFVPKMKYSYTYSSPSSYRNPITWEANVSESGNIVSLIYAACGKKLSEKNKDLLGNPYSQFLKFNTSLCKTWALSTSSQLVGHISAGVIWAYGNSTTAPYNELFYVGGANSIRAFTVRSIGPGKYLAPNTTYAYLDQTGDIKLEGNLEYRFNIVGSFFGALFLDAGNIWLLNKDSVREGAEFRLGEFYKQIATATGLGIRYDMEFLVLRLDLGIALHVPYNTGKSSYYNIPKFGEGLGLHFAIGYPF